MGGYVKSNLIGDEEILYEAKVSLWLVLPKFVLGMLGILLGGLFVFIVLIDASKALKTWEEWEAWELAIPRALSETWEILLVGSVVLFFSLRVCLRVVMNYIATELSITNKRVIAKFGFIRRSTIEMDIAAIESVQIEQGFRGRIFNFGSVYLSGGGNPEASIPGISNPLNFRRKLYEIQENQSGMM